MVEPEERKEKRVRDTGSGQEQMSLVIFFACGSEVRSNGAGRDCGKGAAIPGILKTSDTLTVTDLTQRAGSGLVTLTGVALRTLCCGRRRLSALPSYRGSVQISARHTECRSVYSVLVASKRDNARPVQSD